MGIANFPAIVGAAPQPAIPEPISPELVLIDPELRNALLAQESLARVPLEVVPNLEPPPPTPPVSAPEREPLNRLVQTPAGKLPRALIDSKTGLAKNGLQAVCRSENARSFLCVVQPPKHRPGEGLYVRYRLNGKGNGGTFTWYRYRNG